MHPRSKLSQVQRLEGRIRLHGRLCLVSKPTRKQHSFDTKMEILRRHKAGETRSDLAQEFGLSSPDLISHWAWEVNKDGIDALRPKPKGRPKGSARPTPLTEEDKLRRENELLKAELAYLKKLRDLRDQRRS